MQQHVNIKHLSDFEWASACKYMTWASQTLGMAEVRNMDIQNFPLAKYGVTRLIKRKEATKAQLEDNLSRLSRFVGRYEGKLEKLELVLLRTMYKGIRQAIETVDDHIDQAKHIRRVMQSPLEYEDIEDDRDDYLF